MCEGCMRVIPTCFQSSVQQTGPSRSQWGLLHIGESVFWDGPGKHLWLPARAALWYRSLCPQTCGRWGDSGSCPSAVHKLLQRGRVVGWWFNKITKHIRGNWLLVQVLFDFQDVLPPLLLVVGARGPRVVMIDGRLPKKEAKSMVSLMVHCCMDNFSSYRSNV